MKKHLNLGCAEPPIHPQHIALMEGIAPLEEWGLVDLYVKHPSIINMDATTLEGVDDGSLATIYASHLLEHVSHRSIPQVLGVWHRKLAVGGKLIVNVPDLIWVCRQAIRYENGQPLDGVYSTFEGDRGLQSIFYGTHSHDGEYHKAGFTRRSIGELFEQTGFTNITIDQFFDAHDMGVLLVEGEK